MGEPGPGSDPAQPSLGRQGGGQDWRQERVSTFEYMGLESRRENGKPTGIERRGREDIRCVYVHICKYMCMYVYVSICVCMHFSEGKIPLIKGCRL